MAFQQAIRVRYGDCDMQGVAFNAAYLAWVDDTIDTWLRTELGHDYLDRFDFHVKRVTVTWDAPSTRGDVLIATPAVVRWGTTSFDITVTLDCDGSRVATVESVLVSISPGTHQPTPVADDVRAALGEPS